MTENPTPPNDLGVLPYVSAATEPPPKKPFNVHWSAILSYFISAAVCIALTIKFSPIDPSNLAAHCAGLAVGILLFSIIPAALGFYLARRSKTVATILFFVFLSLITLGQFSQALHNLRQAQRSKAAAIMAEVDRKTVGFLAEAKSGPLDPDKTVEYIGQVQESTDAAAKSLSGDDAAIMRTRSLFMLQMKNTMERYNDALKDIVAESVMKPTWIKTPEDLARARAHIMAFQPRVQELRDFYSNTPSFMTAELAKARVNPATAHNFTVAFTADFFHTKTQFDQLRNQDDQMVQCLLQLCDLLDKNWGQWSLNPISEKIIFQSTDVADAYNSILVTLKQLVADQNQTRREMAGLITH